MEAKPHTPESSLCHHALRHKVYSGITAVYLVTLKYVRRFPHKPADGVLGLAQIYNYTRLFCWPRIFCPTLHLSQIRKDASSLHCRSQQLFSDIVFRGKRNLPSHARDSGLYDYLRLSVGTLIPVAVLQLTLDIRVQSRSLCTCSFVVA